jgi:hypothetical protein
VPNVVVLGDDFLKGFLTLRTIDLSGMPGVKRIGKRAFQQCVALTEEIGGRNR